MMRKFTFIFIYPFLISVHAQVNEKVLADTVQFILQSSERLQCAGYEQQMLRLNFDDCNFEIHHTEKENPDRWNIYSFWLPHLDETKMRLVLQENNEWALILSAPQSEMQYDRNDGSGYTSQALLYADKKEPLVAIGQALFFATQQCKGLDRFKKN